MEILTAKKNQCLKNAKMVIFTSQFNVLVLAADDKVYQTPGRYGPSSTNKLGLMPKAMVRALIRMGKLPKNGLELSRADLVRIKKAQLEKDIADNEAFTSRLRKRLAGMQ